MGQPDSEKKAEKEFNLVWFIFGIMLVMFGLHVLYDPIIEGKGGVSIDMSPFQTPVSIAAVGVGAYLVWSSFVGRRYDGNDVLMCPKCGNSVMKKEVQDGICPACEGVLEPIEGFYDRHPDLDEEKSETKLNSHE